MKVLRMDFSEAETVAQDGLFQHKWKRNFETEMFWREPQACARVPLSLDRKEF
jgi:hypothetical protein